MWKIRLTEISLLGATLFAAQPASAQPPLSLSQAIARAKAHNPDAGSAAAAEREAAERVTQVRGGYFPKVDVAESWQRGNHPVFVFSSLLAQRQFSAADFALDALNHPAATDNFRAAVSVEQSLFDRTTSANVRAASIGRDMAATGRRLVDQDLTSAVTEAFGRVLIAGATARVGSSHGRDRASRPRGGRQPPRRRSGDRRGCPAAGRLPGTHARTAGAGDVGRTHRAREAELLDGGASGHDVLARSHATGDRHRHHQSDSPGRGSIEAPPRSRTRHAAGTAGGRNAWTRRRPHFCRRWPRRAGGS